VKINHHVTFSGPAFVPTSIDETSARETTGATQADVGVDPYDQSIRDALDDINVDHLDSAF
jgi:hypothetical protein